MTTSPSTPINKTRYALLASGADFSCAVLSALQAENFPPRLLILPEYPPSRVADDGDFSLETEPARPQILAQLAEVPVGYAPATDQQAGAELIRQHHIEFLLVACWPYRIADLFLNSASKAAVNLHPSLLPAYRGADPVSAQLAADKVKYGVSLHLMNQRFDEGDIVAQRELGPFKTRPDRCQLEIECARAGAQLFMQAMKIYDRGWASTPQPV